jgi:hypothetical protein
MRRRELGRSSNSASFEMNSTAPTQTLLTEQGNLTQTQKMHTYRKTNHTCNTAETERERHTSEWEVSNNAAVMYVIKEFQDWPNSLIGQISYYSL